MPDYKYTPIDYFSYNRPDYFAAVIVIMIFIVFLVILYLVFLYEFANRFEICHPMFYYSKACQNQNSRAILMNPNFLEMKKMYYDIVAKFDEKTKEYEGVRESTQVSKNKISESDDVIQNNLDQNKDFVKTSVEEIEKLTVISNLIASKYLGNLEEVVRNIQNAPGQVLESMVELPEHLETLKNQIRDTIVNPLFAEYTTPLEKLYKSVNEIDKKTLPYIKKD